MLEELVRADKELFLAIHYFRNGFLDIIMPAFTNRWIWIPLYAFFAWWLFNKFKFQILVILPVVAVMVLVSDQGANLFKNNVQRSRPCHDVELLKSSTIVTPNGCGGPYGFFSGHAANCFALTVFMLLFVRKAQVKNWKPWLLLVVWATLVAWSRIYMGVHFPGDVLAGALFGICVGAAAYYGLNQFYFAKKHA